MKTYHEMNEKQPLGRWTSKVMQRYAKYSNWKILEDIGRYWKILEVR